MREFDFTAFEAAVQSEVGPETDNGPYFLERYARARSFNLPASEVPRLVDQISRIARRHGLTNAGE